MIVGVGVIMGVDVMVGVDVTAGIGVTDGVDVIMGVDVNAGVDVTVSVGVDVNVGVDVTMGVAVGVVVAMGVVVDVRHAEPLMATSPSTPFVSTDSPTTFEIETGSTKRFSPTGTNMRSLRPGQIARNVIVASRPEPDGPSDPPVETHA